MDENIDKDFLLQVVKTSEFKKWLISRRWFANKSEFSDLQYEILLDYFEVIDGNMVLTVIKIIKAGYEKIYFVPLLYFDELENIFEEREKIKENTLKLREDSFNCTINIIEAEYNPLFLKNILSKVIFIDEIPEKFQYLVDVVEEPSNYNFSLKQLGGGNTTNLLFKLKIRQKDRLNQENASIVVKSYKNYAENLETLKLMVLMKNGFKFAPKILGTVKIGEYDCIGLIEKVSNIGNIGGVYWKELNDLVFSVFEDFNADFTRLEDKNQVFELITKNCVKTLEFSSEIGQFIKNMHERLIVSESEDETFCSEFVKSQQCLEPRVNKINSIMINLKFTIKKLTTNSFFDVSHINTILNGVMNVLENLLFKLSDTSIKIQPIHQDLHMEQVLYNTINDQHEFYFTDFEGDPQLSLEENKEKLPIEKDLASFLRSLSYIKYNTLLGYITEKIVNEEGKQSPEEILYYLMFLPEKSEDLRTLKTMLNLLDTWEKKLTEIILKELEPNTTLVDFFTIERTLQEINYEVLYRPDKIIVPLLGLKEIIEKE